MCSRPGGDRRAVCGVQLGERPLQRLAQHPEGEASLQLGAAGGEYGHAGSLGLCPDLLHQARLPDPGRALDHSQPAVTVAGLRQAASDPRHLAGPVVQGLGCRRAHRHRVPV
jgi:hypothetical protein